MTEIHVLHHLHQLISKGFAVCTDSRQAGTGSIFFALKGDRFNGNLFALNALENGCEAVVVDEPVGQNNSKIIQVDSVLQTLQMLGLHHRQQFSIPVIGLTGSNGKTTTKELIHKVLSSSFNTLATQGNLNNHIGVPLTLLRLNTQHEIAIVEMGANHVGEIALLSQLAQPTHGLITNIGKAHLEGFGSVENILLGKTELYRHIQSKQGTLFVNGNNEKLMTQSEDISRVLFGTADHNHLTAILIDERPMLKIAFSVRKSFGKAEVGNAGICSTQLVGAYNFENVLAALTIGLFFGVAPHAAAQAIESYQPANSRSQIVENGKNTILLDAYNANPTSMAAALQNFAGFGKTPRAALLGDMLELGIASREEHQQIANLAQKLDFDLTILVGKEFSHIAIPSGNFQKFDSVEQARDWLKQNPLLGYHVLVKGSRGIKMEKSLDVL
ncbi:MAG TPA: UDP-N-acetylmuramoyl-tripeptide--D-alanyl-D-alanine ligase [Bacteroidales bacterium]|nr:UDP-N-acetylmuramoyl-tripeptide--D-alanyl-D-alanine ligase [Bacteroidales bacterium]